MKDCMIRNEMPEEWREVEELVRESFWNVYRPGCLEHFVLHELRGAPEFVQELNFVLVRSGHIIGQTVFVRAEVAADDGRHIPLLAMGPICIAPDCRRQGYGKRLLDASLERAAAWGAGAVCFEGNIDFYGKSGFTPASRFGIRYHGLAADEEADFFLAKELKPGYLAGITGEYTPPKPYFVEEAAAEEFDRGFPPKEKLHLPGQIF